MSRRSPKARKVRVGVVFGGRSVEHEVSIVSARSVMAALDPRRFHAIPIGITPDGRWITGKDAVRFLESGGKRGKPRRTGLQADPTVARMEGGEPRPDVLFPVLHGSFGEDGTIQGLFEMAGVPYVGAAVAGSAIGMDKVVTKRLWTEAGLPVLPYVAIHRHEYRRAAARLLAAAAKALGFPLFVKPSNSGSSVGISKAKNPRELRAAAGLALRYDDVILVEKGIDRAREIEVAVLGNEAPKASIPGEIVPSNEFYDYDAKYVDGKSAAHIPAVLPAATLRRIRELAVHAYRALGCEGMSRVDFLVHPRTLRVWLNEVNTIPGFTSISMYPKLWEASGLPYAKLLERLIELALARHARKVRLLTAYKPKSRWYR